MSTEIFKAYDVRGLVDKELNEDIVRKIGVAYSNYLEKDGPIAIGYDMRASSIPYCKALVEGITSTGRDVWVIGLVSTDMVYFTVGNHGLAGGAMITASHNPAEYNGLKLCREDAIPVSLDDGLDEVRDNLDGFADSQVLSRGKVFEKDVYGEWIKHALGYIELKNFEGLKIVVDSGNGMMGAVIPKVMKYLPKVTLTPLYFKLDGNFPNHEANPMKTETLVDLGKMVVKTKSDFGIAFDGDGDRVGFVDEDGNVVDGSMLFAVLSSAILKTNPNANIVHELRMSKNATDLIKSMGGSSIRAKVGNPAIKEAMRNNNSPLGGETTGHYVLASNYHIDSGLIACLIIINHLRSSNTSLKEFVETNKKYVSLGETNYIVKNKKLSIEKISKIFKESYQDRLDGLTVNFEDGAWLNVRPSNTEPLLRFNCESKSNHQIEEIKAKVEQELLSD